MVCCFLVPNVRGFERLEGFIHCDPVSGLYSAQVFTLEHFDEGEILTWDISTHNDTFTFTLRLFFESYLVGFPIDLVYNKTTSKGEFQIPEIGRYVLGIYAQSLNYEGFIHYIIDTKQKLISSYSPILIFGIIGIAVIIKIKRLVKNKKQV